MSHEFDFFLRAHGIISQLGALETPQQNFMESSSIVLTFFWGHALDTTRYLHKIVVFKLVSLTL